jgi:uncharacterized protein (TIGR03437 family)
MRFRASVFVLAAALCTVAFADVSGTKALTATTALNLDTGNTSSSGGDLLWNGSILTPQGTAGIFNFLTSGSVGPLLFNSLSQTSLSAVSLTLYTKNGLGGASLTEGAVFAVHTNGGNYAKVLVTSNSGGSVGLQFVTFTASGGGGTGGSGGGGGGGTGGGGSGSGPTPSITAVENAATSIPPGVPNAPIAQGAMFAVKGANLGPADVVIANAFPLTTSIGGTSIKVTVNGTTVDAIMYYSLAAQVAAILPSKTPTGTGTLSLTYNGQTATAPIVVTQSNIGIFTVNTSGTGDAIAFLNSDNGLITPTHAVNGGDVVIFWGTGLGPVSGDETQPATQTDQTNVPLQVFIGGKQANVLFRGRGACCSSIDIVAVTVPDGLSGCAVSVNMRIGNFIGNTTTIATAASGRTCTPVSSTNPGGIGATGTYRIGGIALSRSVVTSSVGATTFTSKADLAAAVFEKITPGSTAPPSGSQVDVNSYGSCTVSFRTGTGSGGTSSGTVQYLDAGASIAMTAPFGNRTLAKSAPGGGIILYEASLDQTATTLAAGQYTFVGTAGADVGAFTAKYTMPAPFVWTNQSSITTVNRANGQIVTWSGGDPSGYVTIAGTSTAYGSTAATTTTVTFTCTARVSDGSFTVPAEVLLGLPVSGSASGTATVVPGTLVVTNVGAGTSFPAPPGIDFAGISSSFIYGSSVTYQ